MRSAATFPTGTTSPSSTRTAGRSATRSSRSRCRRTKRTTTTTESAQRSGAASLLGWRRSAGWWLDRDGQQDPEDAAAVDAAVDLDLSAEQRDDAVADG